MLGYVFKITINQELHYSDTDLGNQLAKQLPNVKIFASNSFHDAFTSHYGTVWGLNVDGVLIKGTYYVVHFTTMCIKFLYILLNHSQICFILWMLISD